MRAAAARRRQVSGRGGAGRGRSERAAGAPRKAPAHGAMKAPRRAPPPALGAEGRISRQPPPCNLKVAPSDPRP